ncbi:nitrile hydratase subunit beta [Streptomyces sp. GMY02]|uniref:SH3-like domain-containing protein n=1 Tax=Streptomyces sp. GMY02 TaxID=1333528 RepID=UPI001C2B9553|nr:SH3-like domain-containing protein [Streptomyces sp. GMY02]QXE33272.1 nitrile hydratase subunit beta [Streptomyces sp. GMY02]
MSRPNDVGGAQGFGALAGTLPPDQPIVAAYGPDGRSVWGADWQARVWALIAVLGTNGVCSASELRDAEERADPGEFLASSYYERVVAGMERLFEERGLLSDTGDMADAGDTADADRAGDAADGTGDT